MPESDLYTCLFKWNLEVPLSGDETERCLRQLGEMGLLQLREREYVLCVNPADEDSDWVKEIDCPGRYMLDAEHNESNRDCRCDECNRILYPSQKQTFRSLSSSPAVETIERFVQEKIAEVSDGFSRERNGLYRLEAEDGNVEVCIADLCRWRDIYSIHYPNSHGVVFVVGNEGDLLPRMPKGANYYNLADLVFGHSLAPFQRELRKFVKSVQKGSAAKGARPRRPGIGKGDPKVVPDPDPWEGCCRFPVKRGTRWDQITLFLQDGLTLGVIAPEHGKKLCTPQDLKMFKEKEKEPSNRWLLLRRILEANGSIDNWKEGPGRHHSGYEKWGPLKNEMSLLRRHLQYIFNMPADSDPFTHFSRGDGIKTAFWAYGDPPEKKPYIDQSAWQKR